MERKNQAIMRQASSTATLLSDLEKKLVLCLAFSAKGLKTMSFVGNHIRGLIDDLSKLNAKDLTEKLIGLIRTLRSFPLVGIEVVHFILVSPEQERPLSENTRHVARELCLRLLAEDASANREFEARVETFLEVNRTLSAKQRPTVRR